MSTTSNVFTRAIISLARSRAQRRAYVDLRSLPPAMLDDLGIDGLMLALQRRPRSRNFEPR
jgi:hypothetical protein